MSQAATTTEIPAARQSWWSVLGWAAYLACSWTWCIGMFLPVLLVRDYGVWGFVVFAVPNVVGAGAMGWVLSSASAERCAEVHRTAIRFFSLVTVAFQIYFAFWLVLFTGNGPVPIWLFVAFIIMLPCCVTAAFEPKRRLWASVFVWAVSIGLFVAFAARGGVSTAHLQSLVRAPGAGLWFLMPVCVFGFALCPYLDATFLLARRQAEGVKGTAAFGLGFGVMFAAMLGFTLCYAWVFLAVPLDRRPEWIGNLVIFHLFVQLTFTIMAHFFLYLRVAQDASRERRAFSAGGLGSTLAIGVALFAAPILFVFWNGDGTHAGMTIGEIIYRCFMSFYGLVFPAYVWLCMIPTADGHSGIGGERGRWKLGVLGLACVVAAPCYWMGFIERAEWWLAPGLGVVLVARLLVRKKALGTGH